MSGSNRGVLVAGAVFVIVLAAVVSRSGGPRPRAADAPASEFSAVRAASALHEIVGDTPHPVGSAAHDAVHDRLAARFRALGYEVTLQNRFACNAYAFCAPVANLIARVPGQNGSDVLLVAAHYDSVPAGPGMSDDGLGVASLIETARAVRAEHFKNTIVFLVTDAEEAGLLGAEGFVADGDASKQVAAVINVDCRGTSGASYMFETSSNNRRLIPIVARSLPRPATSSLYFNIYELLPNDTDMTIFKRSGFEGVNFGNIGNVVHYHTPLDSFANLSLPVLQHHGEHVLAMLRALGDEELRQTSDQNAVWFDVLSFFIVWWPQGLTVWLTLIALAMIIVAAALRIREEETTARAITFGVIAFFGSVITSFVVALGLTLIIRGPTWSAHPMPMIVAAWLIGIAATIVITSLAHRRAGFDGLFLGAGICWSAVAIALLAGLPGGSYLALVPALTIAICAILRAIIDLNDVVIAVIAGAITSVLFFPVAISFYTALGSPALPIIAAVVALVMTLFAPAIAGAPTAKLIARVAFAIAVALSIAAMFLPKFTNNSPRRLNVRYVDDGQSKWQADALTPALRSAADFDGNPHNAAPWSRSGWMVYEAPAPAIALHPVEARVVRDTRDGARRTLVVALHSPRNAPRLSLIFHAPSMTSLRINGVTPPPKPPRWRDAFTDGWRRVSVRGASDAEIEIVTGDGAPIDAIAFDSSYGLPPQGAALAKAREASAAVASDDGDLTQTIRRMKF